MLQTLRLHHNRLAGSIPPEIRCLRRLQGLELQHNSLSGEIPPVCGGDLPQLQVLQLGSNRLVGLIPPSLGELVGLEELWLDHNSLSGPIPAELFPIDGAGAGADGVADGAEGGMRADGKKSSGMQELQWLVLSNNALTGKIPDGLCRCPKLRQVYLQHNKLVGALPLGKSGGATYTKSGGATYTKSDDATYTKSDDATYIKSDDATYSKSGDATYIKSDRSDSSGNNGEDAAARAAAREEQGLGYGQLKVLCLQENLFDTEQLSAQAARLRPRLGGMGDELTVVW